jgi:predicted NBD/HSP70 family sugar kinase
VPDPLELPRDDRSARSGHNLDVVRRSNLSLVLGRVHELRAISRAQLTRETGLNRSTIAELVHLGLVVETSPDPTNQVGRPSPVIVPSERVVALTVLPELDSVSVAVVRLGGTVVRQVRHPTDRVLPAQEAVSIAGAIIDGMRDELASSLTVGIGLAVPGLVRASDGMVILAPHLEWEQQPVGDLLREATGYPVVAGNDANLGAIAETVRGAGRGVSPLVYVNGGASGIGGGIVTGGELLGGASGFAGELGHTLVNSAGATCHCGAVGCLETEVTRGELLAVLGLDETQLDRLESELLARRAEPAVAAFVARQLGYLGRGLANVVNLVNPDLVVLGGFLGPLYDAAPGLLEDAVRGTAMAGPRDDLRIVRSALGSAVLPIGAAELAFAALIADPASARKPPAAVRQH